MNSSWTWTTCLVVMAASGCSQDLLVDPVTVTSVGPGGGTATSHDGHLSVEIPPGALNERFDIRIRTLYGDLAPPSVVSEVYDLSPHGLTFQTPVEIGIRAPDTAEALVIANLDEAVPVDVPGSYYDEATGRAVAELVHFSRYGVVRRGRRCLDGGCGPDTGPHTPLDAGFYDADVPDFGPGFADCGVFDAFIPDGATVPGGDCGVYDAQPAGAPDIGPHDGGPGGRGFLREIEPNDASASAQSVPATSTVLGAISTSGDQDWYRVDIRQAGMFGLQAATYTQLGDRSSCAGIDTVLTAFDATGQQVGRDDDGGAGRCSNLFATFIGPTVAFVRVEEISNTAPPHAYFVDLALRPVGSVVDAGSSFDAGPFLDAGR